MQVSIRGIKVKIEMKLVPIKAQRLCKGAVIGKGYPTLETLIYSLVSLKIIAFASSITALMIQQGITCSTS